eukprot:6751791-Lingulodinium_polyedra.AAC.1
MAVYMDSGSTKVLIIALLAVDPRRAPEVFAPFLGRWSLLARRQQWRSLLLFAHARRRAPSV